MTTPADLEHLRQAAQTYHRHNHAAAALYSALRQAARAAAATGATVELIAETARVATDEAARWLRH